MTSNGIIALKKVWVMLNECAPGHKKTERTHNWTVMYEGKTYYRLPKGTHGRRVTVEIQIGHVRQMTRLLNIEDCAKKKIPQL